MRTRLDNGKRSRINIGNSRTRLSSGNRSKLNGVPGSNPNPLVFRILENNDFRITEDDNFRILE